jgi:hypothetical protein
MAAVYYAAMLLPDPTLSPTSDRAAHTAYSDTGLRLARLLLRPAQVTKVRCCCDTHRAHPGRPARLLLTVHDRRLALVRLRRGPVQHSVTDLAMAQREGNTYLGVWCHSCSSRHRLPLPWLEQASHTVVATEGTHYDLDPLGHPLRPGDPEPPQDDPNDAFHSAFAHVTGSIQPPTDPLVVTLSWQRAWRWRHTFGLEPPCGDHFAHLIGEGERHATLRFPTLLTRAGVSDPAALSAEAEAIRKAHAQP